MNGSPEDFKRQGLLNVDKIMSDVPQNFSGTLPTVLYLLVPCVLETNVFPIWRMLNIDGALTSYQSFLEKGSTLEKQKTS